ATGTVRGRSAIGHDDQPAGVAAVLHCHYSAGLARCSLFAAFTRSGPWALLGGRSGSRLGDGPARLVGCQIPALVATSRLVGTAVRSAVIALAQLALVSGALDLVARWCRSVIGFLACFRKVAVACAGCGAGVGGAAQPR